MSHAPYGSVLVLAPHPDDETFGCGGTIKILTLADVNVDVLFMTRGEMGFEAPEGVTDALKRKLAQTRTEEAYQACAILGVHDVFFADGQDGRLGEQPELAPLIRERIEIGGYDRIFCPWPGDNHLDHKATFELLQHALAGFQRSLQCWLYEVWTPMMPAMCLPIDQTLDAKRKAAEVYRSQLAYLDYKSAFLGLSAYRSLFCPGARHAEAFQIVNFPLG